MSGALRRGALALFAVGAAACSRPPLLVAGAIELTDRPTTARFIRPVQANGAVWELCFEFDLPRDSLHASAIRVTLMSAAGRAPLQDVELDRRGEATVCQIGRVADAAQGAPPLTYEGIELQADEIVQIRGIRGGSRS